jgi:hypothetical protein
MSISKLEQKVRENAVLLDEKMEVLAKSHFGQYVVFNGVKAEYSSDLGSALKKGDKIFGESTGFVVRKIRKNIPIFACLTEV